MSSPTKIEHLFNNAINHAATISEGCSDCQDGVDHLSEAIYLFDSLMALNDTNAQKAQDFSQRIDYLEDIINQSFERIKISKTHNVNDVEEWLNEHTEDNWYSFYEDTYLFNNKQDAMRFKLAWG